jgi:hypothetical protein
MASTYDKCPTCGEFGWLRTHKCPPLWHARHEDDDEDCSRPIHAKDAKKAAEKFAAWSDCYQGDWSNPEQTVVVQDRDGNQLTFIVEMQPVPEYTARTPEETRLYYP